MLTSVRIGNFFAFIPVFWLRIARIVNSLWRVDWGLEIFKKQSRLSNLLVNGNLERVVREDLQSQLMPAVVLEDLENGCN